MSLRDLVPDRLHGTVRETYTRVGAATAPLRLRPGFMVVGGQRCGTTSLFRALSEHPRVLRPPVNKGTDYYTLHYHRGPEWYQGHFPLRRIGGRANSHDGVVAFEACTYYLFHPFALERIAREFPSMKLVVMLRDPVERAFSAYKHELARGFEWEGDFERALALEDERLIGETERMANDVAYESFAHRHHAYRRRGLYAEQLERAFNLFPPDQIHILDSEQFFAEPAKEYRRLLDFLDLSAFEPRRFDQHNARPSSSMPSAARRTLEAYYAPHDERLAELTGRTPYWAR